MFLLIQIETSISKDGLAFGYQVSGSTIRTLLYGKINPKDWQVLLVSGDVSGFSYSLGLFQVMKRQTLGTFIVKKTHLQFQKKAFESLAGSRRCRRWSPFILEEYQGAKRNLSDVSPGIGIGWIGWRGWIEGYCSSKRFNHIQPILKQKNLIPNLTKKEVWLCVWSRGWRGTVAIFYFFFPQLIMLQSVNGCIWKVITSGDTPIFRWTMIRATEF